MYRVFTWVSGFLKMCQSYPILPYVRVIWLRRIHGCNRATAYNERNYKPNTSEIYSRLAAWYCRHFMDAYAIYTHDGTELFFFASRKNKCFCSNNQSTEQWIMFAVQYTRTSELDPKSPRARRSASDCSRLWIQEL